MDGFYQSLGIRALSGGLYFPLEHLFLQFWAPNESNPMNNLLSGTAAGAVNAILLNPLSAIKYKTWGKRTRTTTTRTKQKKNDNDHDDDNDLGMFMIAKNMFQKAGYSIRPFLNGIKPTLYRDVVFGGCYTWLRLQIQVWYDLPPQSQWQANVLAASLATIVSGPFNYARNVQYATSSSQQASSTWSTLRDLMNQARQRPNFMQRILFLTNRLRIGWGTARVGMGVAFGHYAYDHLHNTINCYFNAQTNKQTKTTTTNQGNEIK